MSFEALLIIICLAVFSRNSRQVVAWSLAGYHMLFFELCIETKASEGNQLDVGELLTQHLYLAALAFVAAIYDSPPRPSLPDVDAVDDEGNVQTWEDELDFNKY